MRWQVNSLPLRLLGSPLSGGEEPNSPLKGSKDHSLLILALLDFRSSANVTLGSVWSRPLVFHLGKLRPVGREPFARGQAAMQVKVWGRVWGHQGRSSEGDQVSAGRQVG